MGLDDTHADNAMTFRVAAPAKINLFLHVGPPGQGGRHPLDSLVMFGDTAAADRLSFEPGAADAGFELHRTPDQDWPEAEDFVLRAASGLRARVPGLNGGKFRLEKHLPVASGLGGGTADGVAALRLLAAAHSGLDLSAECAEVARTLGGDGPACWLGLPCRMQGDGDRVTPVAIRRRLPVVLVNPGQTCSTGEVYRRYDELADFSSFSPPPSLPDLDAMNGPTLLHWLARCRNDLSAAASAVCPQIRLVLDALAQTPGARLVRVSGSGATCFAIFDSFAAAHVAAGLLGLEFPRGWVQACEINTGLAPVERVTK